MILDPPLDQRRWYEERLRYQVLRLVFDRVGPSCDVALTGPQIESSLGLHADEVLRVVGWLGQHGYVHPLGSRPDICLTPKAVAYFETGPERRKSLRE